jgi:hypothetical protein
LSLPEEVRSDYDLYRKLVYKYTRTSLRKYKKIINPNNLKRGRNENEHHLDHKFSISEGFKNGIPPCIIGSQHNLEYILSKDNLIKLNKCTISLTNLCDIYYKNM